MMLMKRFTIVIILVFFLGVLYSQNNWTLEQCIQYAMDNNLQIKQQELYSLMNQNNLESSFAGIFPSLNAGGNQNFTFGRSVDPFTNEFATQNVSSSSVSLASSATLFSGMRQINNVKKSRADYQAGLFDLEQTKNNISLLIASAYLNVLYNYDLLEIAEQQAAITSQQLDRIIVLVESGSLPLQNRYELEAQLANEELNIVNLQNALDFSLLNLAQIIEVDDTEKFGIVKPNIDNISIENVLISVDQIYNEAVNNMPQVEAAKYRTESAYRTLLMAKGSRYPQLNLSLSYGTGYSNARKEIDQIILGQPIPSGFRIDDLGDYIFDVYQYSYDYSYITRPFADQIKDNASAGVGFNLSIPIFNGWQIKNNISNANLQYQQTKLQAIQVNKDLLKDIQQAQSDAQAAAKKYFATEKTLEAMQLSFDYTQQRFDLGLLTSVDYNLAKNNLIRTQSELVRAKYDFVFKQKILEFYRGIKISL